MRVFLYKLNLLELAIQGMVSFKIFSCEPTEPFHLELRITPLAWGIILNLTLKDRPFIRNKL
jgi:hypothetical protein